MCWRIENLPYNEVLAGQDFVISGNLFKAGAIDPMLSLRIKRLCFNEVVLFEFSRHSVFSTALSAVQGEQIIPACNDLLRLTKSASVPEDFGSYYTPHIKRYTLSGALSGCEIAYECLADSF